MREITINDLRYVYHFMATYVRWLQNDFDYVVPEFHNSLQAVLGKYSYDIYDILEHDKNEDTKTFDALRLEVKLKSSSSIFRSEGTVTVCSNGNFSIDSSFHDLKEFEGIQLLLNEFVTIVEKYSKEAEIYD